MLVAIVVTMMTGTETLLTTAAVGSTVGDKVLVGQSVPPIGQPMPDL